MARILTCSLLLGILFGSASHAARGQEKVVDKVEVSLPIRELRAPRGPLTTPVVYSRDGKLLAVGAGKDVVLWNTTDGKEVARIQLPYKPVQCHLIFATDGKTLIMSGQGDSKLRFFDVKTGQQVREYRQPRPGHHFLAFSPDAKYVVYHGTTFFKGVDVFELATGKWLLPLDEPEDCRGCDFSSDGKLLATISGTQRGLRLWDLATGKLRKQISAGDGGSPGAYAYVKFSPDGKFLVTGGHNADTKVWDIATAKVLRTLDNGYELRTFAPDGQSVLSVTRNQAALHHLSAEKDICIFQPPVKRSYFACFSPDFQRVAVLAPSSAGGLDLSANDGQASVYLFRVPPKAFDPAAANFDDAPLEALWSDLNTDNELRRQVVRKAFRAAPKPAVALVAKKISPISKNLQRHVEKLIANLDDNSFRKRDEAMSEIQGLAHQFSPLLKKRLRQAPAGEVRNRLTFVLETMSAEKLPVVLRTNLRAIAILEELGTKDARAVLDQLAHGADGARLTVEAQAALERLPAKTK
jgi:WD40 repeat protein